MVRVLAISGSLRKTSSNTALLRAASLLAPEGIEITLYAGLDTLPFFNPDTEENALSSVIDWRENLWKADGILIASPEYAHGVTGVLKNALDWVVGSGELTDKPIAVLNASLTAVHGYASLTETLKIAGAHLVPEASLAIPLTSNRVDTRAILLNPELSRALIASVGELASAIRIRQAGNSDGEISG